VSKRDVLTGALAAAALLLTGCAATGASDEPDPAGDMSPGMSMTHREAASGSPAVGAPSEAARMICTAEIREAVGRATELESVAKGTSSWAGRLYTCTYQLRGGPLVLSVEDSAKLAAGRRYFTALHDRATSARPLRGLLNFGLPSYQTSAGSVVFLKDGKTLTVDATELPTQNGKAPTDVAYAVAAAVVACWTE
jgi:hypothetical protein